MFHYHLNSVKCTVNLQEYDSSIMSLSEQLKILAQGINPETGELLPKSSIVNTVEVTRMLYLLSDELSEKNIKAPTKRKKRVLSEEETIQLTQKNITEGKPERSHFPWDLSEVEALKISFSSDLSFQDLAVNFQRSELAIAAQLEKLGAISNEEFETIKNKN